MKILIDCEESQAVCKAFREKGHEAYSCDIQDCSGGHPEWHIKGDAIRSLRGGYLTLQNGDQIYIEKWDLIIAHPVCKFLANSGVKHMYVGGRKENGFDPVRCENMFNASKFFRQFILHHKLYKTPMGIENPIMHCYAKEEIFGTVKRGKPTQIIQPYQFGHLEQKATCLWLYGLPSLKETNNVYDEMMKLPYKDRAKVHYASPGPDRDKLRSKTFPGIAAAMANQWSDLNN